MLVLLATYSQHCLKVCMYPGFSSVISSQEEPCMWWAQTVTCMHVASNTLKDLTDSLYGPGFSTWQDEDFIGRAAWMHALYTKNLPLEHDHVWLWCKVCRVSRRCHALRIALTTTTRCLSHYRRLWGKKRWLRWKHAQCICSVLLKSAGLAK